MHSLPLEIQHEIFVLACTDGGRTGLALSLTSRSYRDAARPVRLHSVAIRAFSHIEGALRSYKRDQAELEASGSTLKPQVRHLLLSPADKGPNDDDVDEDETYTALAALLQLLGPTLRTLAYTAPISFSGLCSSCPISMPKLEELTILLNEHEHQPKSQPTAARPSYPALQKLHVVLSYGAAAVPDLMSWWSDVAPNVTDLRLTNVGRSDGGRHWLQSMMDGDRTKRPYPSVRRIFVEPYQRPIGGKCGTPRAKHGYFVKELKAVKKQVPEDIQFILKGKDLGAGSVDRIAAVERYWTDSTNGGEGGWRQSKRLVGRVDPRDYHDGYV
ncbi:hypothetical protein LXA43DRAFT_61413 [Ganoderma leucocontextum]|nr:hypothetical protein LXA43DRAFT_61413 [Ganoderma leucocontextum]